MESLKFTISKNSCKTAPKNIKPCHSAKMLGFRSNIKDLAIILEDKGSKSIYYTNSTKNGFIKHDPLEFEKVWLEYNKSDKDYFVELLVG